MNTFSNEKWIRGIAIFLLIFCSPHLFGWGFFGHKIINQQAVYSLPLPLQKFFIPHQDFLSIHAVDPDKRRYAIKEEGFQHYFDTEKWQCWMDTSESSPDRQDLLRNIGHLGLIDEDTVWIDQDHYLFDSIVADVPRWYSGSVWDFGQTEVLDTMAFHGMLPITLNKYYQKLVRAFRSRELDLSLKIAAELGHYLGDAHVPLHTTVNYNGQLTNQIGIHALWETHVPELLAESTFDWVVGPAVYLEEIPQSCWEIVDASHEMVDSVLAVEVLLRERFHDADETCFRHRGGKVQNLPCESFLQAYETEMSHMVERQMRKSISAIASFWWSAYVEAGQPVLSGNAHEEVKKEQVEGDFKGRCD